MDHTAVLLNAIQSHPFAAPFAILFVLLLFDLSLLAHELGHAFAISRILGTEHIQEIHAGIGTFFRRGRLVLGILPVWGYVRFDEATASPFSMLLIYLSGPLASFFAGILFLLLSFLPIAQNWQHAFLVMCLANFALGAFNLLPIPPLDGWKVVEAYLPRFGIHLSIQQRQALYRRGMAFLVLATGLFLLIHGFFQP